VSDRLDAYLAELGGRLPPGTDRERVVDEARDHLLDAAARHARAGLSSEEALRRAIGDFGAAGALARQFDARPRWRRLGAGLLTGIIRRRAVAQRRERACSFCGKAQSQVKRMIAGPNVHICSECVALCNEIIARHEAEGQPNTAPA
jgi:hypothetical protein